MALLVSWSSGKDSAWCLEALRDSGQEEVVGLVTTVNEAVHRVAMHAVRLELLERQAAAVDLPLFVVPLPYPCSNEDYEARMGAFVVEAKARGIEGFAFGDLFLDEVRRYRESKLAAVGLRALFPLWGRDTRVLAKEMLAAGLGATVTCVDPRVLDRSFVGRTFDAAFLEDLPEGVDPCGERGEFHTFVWAAPGFRSPLSVRAGEVVERDGFVFADLLPDDGA